MVVVTDLMSGTPDMGERVLARSLIGALGRLARVDMVEMRRSGWTSKTMLSSRIIWGIRRSGACSVLYVPASSLTIASALRARVLHALSGKPVAVISLQPRDVTRLQWLFDWAIRPLSVLATSKASAARMPARTRIGVIPPAIDLDRFARVEDRNVPVPRNPDDARPIVLHVGHISRTRGLDALLALARNPKLHVVLVASTSTPQDSAIAAELREAGVSVMTEFIEHIEDLYHSASVYVFPVIDNQGCIDTPMSVLEALASDVPVVSTRFGALPEILQQAPAFRFVDDPSMIPEITAEMVERGPQGARSLVNHMTWENAARSVLDFISPTRTVS